MDSQWMYLPSNASLDYFPDNTMSTYTVKLPHTMMLEGDWEVALADISFPTNLSALHQGGKIMIGALPFTEEQRDSHPPIGQIYPFNTKDISIVHQFPVPEPTDDWGTEVKMTALASGHRAFLSDFPANQHYSSPEAFINALNRFFQDPTSFSGILDARYVRRPHGNPDGTIPGSLPGERWMEHPIEFAYSEEDGLEVRIRDSQLLLNLSPSIARVLGFPVHDKVYITLEGRGIYRFPDNRLSLIADQCRLFYVYTNISAPIVVGDVTASALRSVNIPIPTDPYQVVSKEYDTLHYVKVALKTFDLIEIYLRDPAGQPVPFQSGGIVQVLLHFRRVG